MTFRRITLVLGFVALGTLAWKLGWSTLLAGLARLGPCGWLVVLALQALAFAADALSLKACAGPLSPQLPFLTSLRACVVAQAVNTVTPFGQLGETHKFRRLPATWPLPTRAGTVLLHNHVLFLGTCAGIALGLGLGALAIGPHHARFGRLAFLAAGSCLLVGAGAQALLARGPGARVRALIARLGRRWPRLGRLGASADEATVAAGRLARSRSMGFAFAAALFKRVLLVLEALIVLRQLDCPSASALALLSSGGSQLVAWSTSFVPGQLGTAEAGSALLFQVLGVSSTIGLSLELVRRGRRLIIAAVGLMMA